VVVRLNLIKELYECICKQNIIIALPYDRFNEQDILLAVSMLNNSGYKKFKDYKSFALYSCVI